MPKFNSKISLTQKFTENTANTIDCQEAPKFILRCMWDKGKNGYFTYGEL